MHEGKLFRGINSFSTMRVMTLDNLLILISLIVGISTQVPPPENVTVSCHNLQAQVYWNYSEHLPLHHFILNYTDGSRFHVVDTTDHHHDLTSFLWSSEYLDFYVVTVTAMSGTETSKDVKSRVFTYNDLMTASIKCQLDFPPINLRRMDMGLFVSFANPLHYYEQLGKSPYFQDIEGFVDYNVLFENTTLPCERCRSVEKTCSCSFQQIKEGQYCVNLEGSINNRIVFKRSVPICVPENETIEPHYIVIIMMTALFVIVIIVLTLMVCKASAWKTTPYTFPKNVASLLANPSDRRVMEVPREYLDHISAVEPASAPLHSTPPQITEEEGRLETTNSTESEDDSGVPIGHEYLTNGWQPSKLAEMIEVRRPCSGRFEAEDANSGTLEEEELFSPSGYDRAQRLDEREVEVEMATRDMVKGYALA